jgi:hypothetical protein
MYTSMIYDILNNKDKFITLFITLINEKIFIICILLIAVLIYL